MREIPVSKIALISMHLQYTSREKAAGDGRPRKSIDCLKHALSPARWEKQSLWHQVNLGTNLSFDTY